MRNKREAADPSVFVYYYFVSGTNSVKLLVWTFRDDAELTGPGTHTTLRLEAEDRAERVRPEESTVKGIDDVDPGLGIVDREVEGPAPTADLAAAAEDASRVIVAGAAGQLDVGVRDPQLDERPDQLLAPPGVGCVEVEL